MIALPAVLCGTYISHDGTFSLDCAALVQARFKTYQTYKQNPCFFGFFFITGLTSFIMAAHIPAATGSMTVIECNWNSNWIADIRRGSNLAFLYNSITKLSHHFRTQTNKVEQQQQQKKKKRLQEPWRLDPQKKKKKRKAFSTWDARPPQKRAILSARMSVCVCD